MKSCTIAKVCLKSFKKSPRDCHPVSFEAEIFWLHDFSSLILVSLTIRSLNFFDIVCKNCPKFAELLACILSGVLCKKESKFLSFGSTISNSCNCTYRKVVLFTVRQSTLSPIIPRRQRKVFWLCLQLFQIFFCKKRIATSSLKTISYGGLQRSARFGLVLQVRENSV